MATRSILGTVFTLQAFQQIGVNVEPVLKQLGISLDALDMEAQIDRGRDLLLMEALFKQASELGVSDTLGISFGQKFGLAGYGPLPLLLMTAKNGLAACNLGIKFQDLTYLHCRLEMDTDTGLSDEIRLALIPEALPKSIERFLLDRDLAGVVKFVQDIAESTQTDIPILSIRMSSKGQMSVAEYQRRFQCPIIIDSKKVVDQQKAGDSSIRAEAQREERNLGNSILDRVKINPSEKIVICLKRSSLMHPFPQANNYLNHYYEIECDKLIKKQESFNKANNRWELMVENHLMLFINKFPTFQEVATSLDVPERSLRRHLQNENTSFQKILDKVRFQKSKEYLLESSDSVGEISGHLGYSEPSAFLHAFKRWSGMNPLKFRKMFSHNAID